MINGGNNTTDTMARANLGPSLMVDNNENIAQLKQQRLDAAMGKASPKSSNVQGAIFKTQADFINYLTAMFKNRTPDDNFDMAQMAGVFATMGAAQQTFAMADKMDQMMESQRMYEMLQTVNQVGRIAEVSGDQLYIGDDKSAIIKYTPPKIAEKVKVLLRKADSGKVVVNMTSGKLSPADYKGITMEWDGSTPDQKIPLGRYRIEIRALDKNGREIFDEHTNKMITIPTTIIDRVTGATHNNGAVSISMGSVHMPLRSLLGVHESMETIKQQERATSHVGQQEGAATRSGSADVANNDKNINLDNSRVVGVDGDIINVRRPQVNANLAPGYNNHGGGLDNVINRGFSIFGNM